MPGSFRLGKIAGIEIDINVSWIIILVLLTVSLATGWFPQLYPGWSIATYCPSSFTFPMKSSTPYIGTRFYAPANAFLDGARVRYAEVQDV